MLGKWSKDYFPLLTKVSDHKKAFLIALLTDQILSTLFNGPELETKFV